MRELKDWEILVAILVLPGLVAYYVGYYLLFKKWPNLDSF